MLTYAEPGTEYLIPYAKKKLEYFKQLLGGAGVNSFHRRIDVDNGSAIYIDSIHLGNGRYNDQIRVTGGGAYQYRFGSLPESQVSARYTTFADDIYAAPRLRTSLFGTTELAHLAHGEWEIFGPGGVFPMGTGAHSFEDTGALYGYAELTWGKSVFTNFLLSDGTLRVENGTKYYWGDGTFGYYSSNVYASITDFPEYNLANADPLAQLMSGVLPSTWEAYLRGLYPYLPDDVDIVPKQLVTMVLFAPVVDGVSNGLFGHHEGKTATEVLGKAVLRFDPAPDDGPQFVFDSWSDPEVRVIDVVSPSYPDTVNVMLRWNGKALYPLPSELQEFGSALLGAFRS